MLKKLNIRELFFYCLGGGGGAIINFALAYYTVSILKLDYVIGITIASFANLTFNFIFHRAFTFGVKDKTAQRAMAYYILGVIYFFVSLGFAIFLKSVVGLHYMVAQVLATALIVIINFFASKYFVFKKS